MASYCGKCNKIWDGSVDFLSCESCSAAFDIECLKITKTVFKATNDNKNWSWRCDSCRYSSYRTMTNAIKELTTVVNIMRSAIDLIKKQLDHAANGANLSSSASLPVNNKRDKIVDDGQSINKVDVTAKAKPKQSAPKSIILTRSQQQVVKKTAPDPCQTLSAPAITFNDDDVFIQAAETPVKKWLYLTNVKPSTTVENVRSFIVSKMDIQADSFAVFKLVKKGADISLLTFASFKIGFNSTLDTSRLKSLLPANVRISDFVERNVIASNQKN